MCSLILMIPKSPLHSPLGPSMWPLRCRALRLTRSSPRWARKAVTALAEHGQSPLPRFHHQFALVRAPQHSDAEDLGRSAIRNESGAMGHPLRRQPEHESSSSIIVPPMLPWHHPLANASPRFVFVGQHAGPGRIRGCADSSPCSRREICPTK